MFVLVVAPIANDHMWKVHGQMLKAFDFEADGGRGYGVFTWQYQDAMKFATVHEAIGYTRVVSKTVPLRQDGQPNRPLSSTMFLIARIENDAGTVSGAFSNVVEGNTTIN